MTLSKTLLLLLAMSCLGCAKKPEPEGYRVVNYDRKTHEWVILRNGTFDGRYSVKRMTVMCSWYRLGNNEPLYGPDVCYLEVGRMMIPNPFPKKRSDFFDIYEMGMIGEAFLTIAEGEGPDKVTQAFTVLKSEVLPESAYRH